MTPQEKFITYFFLSCFLSQFPCTLPIKLNLILFKCSLKTDSVHIFPSTPTSPWTSGTPCSLSWYYWFGIQNPPWYSWLHSAVSVSDSFLWSFSTMGPMPLQSWEHHRSLLYSCVWIPSWSFLWPERPWSSPCFGLISTSRGPRTSLSSTPRSSSGQILNVNYCELIKHLPLPHWDRL